MTRKVSILIRIFILIWIAFSFSFPYPASAYKPIPDATPPGAREPDNPDKPKTLSSLTSLVVEDLTGTLTPEQLANQLVGSGISVSNISFTGSNLSAGNFSEGLAIVGFDSGIILSSGAVLDTIGPNISDSTSTELFLNGDPDLTTLSGYPTNDATVLEFDFVPDQDQVSFQFTFASEEYNEYVHSVFNDVFAFYINGQNCALIDGDPISINTINNGNPYGLPPTYHSQFYLNNDIQDGGGKNYETEMDGLTFVLTCASAVTPNQTNHMKLAIADASDMVWDSAVFIRAGSITTERLPVILIPGMGASVNYECFLKELFCGLDSRWGWFTIFAESVYSPLIDRLEAAGYTTDNNYLNVFYYDWRKPIEANVPRLKKRIDDIKKKTGKDQVDLVGHSMGGLLARAYVQSDIFDPKDDVSHMVTLGSPHRGAAKAYPYWQAANVYEMGDYATPAINLFLLYYMQEQINPVKVFVLRNKFPSFKDLLPIDDYLLDNDTNAIIPESTLTLQNRNTYLHELDNNNSVLFERADVATFVGENIQTTARFYVGERSFLDSILFKWDDGKPNWDRQSEFYSDHGDETVLSESGKVIGSDYERDFPDINHTGLTKDNNVINAVFAYLGITVAPDPAPSTIPEILIFILDGFAEAIFTDPLGRILRPTTQVSLNSKDLQSDPIPEAEYIQVPGNTFQIILIPNPLNGDYQIQVDGLGEGDYTLGRLDTFSEPLEVPVPVESFWDLSNSQIQDGKTVNYTLSYSGLSNEIGNLMAITPVIETPVWVGDSEVTGRGLLGSTMIIKDFNSNGVLGSGIVNADGFFQITLSKALKIRQQIFPVSSGLTGSVVTVKSHDIFLPLSLR